MATRLMRVLVGAAALLMLLAGSASAQTASATFASPSSSPAGQAIWVRSITPCPAADASVARWVEARFTSLAPRSEGSVVQGDVRDDGHWDLTLPAPDGPSGGATGLYFVEAQCMTTTRPPADAVTVPTQKYDSREIQVTSGGFSSGSWSDGPVGGAATTTTSTTTTTVPTTTTVAAAAVASTTTTTASGSGAASFARATDSADIRAEIAKAARRSGVDDVVVPTTIDDGVALGGSNVAAERTPEPDAGIPAWAFLCAALLAVGAVIAYGARRDPDSAGQ